jgi:drug/metabolite transporter (DMT)-like permease
MHHPKHLRACFWLIVATAFWGISFPLIKAIWLAQEQLVPAPPNFFLASAATVVRFGTAGVIMALFAARTLCRLTRLEFTQGINLGIFCGLGILFQMDGLAHTPASTSAFLTPFYCILIPVWVACRKRAWPGLAVMASLVLAGAGIAILSEFNWREFKMGRGEAETLLSSVFFAGQILLLERPCYSENRATHFTLIMFATIALLAVPVVVFTAPSAHAIVRAYSSPEVLALVGVLALACTLAAYMLMNVWQSHVTATEAGLIYCVEPICAALFAVVLPGWLSRFAKIDYANERITMNLLIGGGLITGANVLIQIEAMRQRRKAVAASRSE